MSDTALARHFTATGFVVYRDSLLLHWHRKVKMWLPPGGHIEPNEDPVEAVLREIREEAGVRAEVVPTGMAPELAYPARVHAPFTIMIEDIDDPAQGFHQHIDMIYFCRLAVDPFPVNDGWFWVGKQALAEGRALRPGNMPELPAVAPPEDVRALAACAFEVVGGV